MTPLDDAIIASLTRDLDNRDKWLRVELRRAMS
jgi:hypothetical protein